MIVTRGLGRGAFAGAIVAAGLCHESDQTAQNAEGELEQFLGDVSGEGVFNAKSSQYVGAIPGGRHGIIPSPAFIVAEYQQQEIARQLLLAPIYGDGAVEQFVGDVSGQGRVVRLKLVATADISQSSGADVSASGEFVDVELEMAALALALAA